MIRQMLIALTIIAVLAFAQAAFMATVLNRLPIHEVQHVG